MPKWKLHHAAAALAVVCAALAVCRFTADDPAIGFGFACNAIIGVFVTLFVWTATK